MINFLEKLLLWIIGLLNPKPTKEDIAMREKWVKHCREGAKKLAILLVLPLVGCAEYVPIAGSLVGMADDSVVYVKDASIAKEMAVHQTLRNRDNKYATAYKESGTQIDFEMKEIVPGIWIQTIKSVSSKSPPHFAGNLPTEPSKHPLWNTADKAIDVLGKFGLGWLAVDAMKSSWDATAPQYSGPYNSYNQTAEPFIVQPTVITP